MKVIIVGGVAGGASAAARLRRLDENAEIILLEKGEYVSFANCGLPYYLGGTIKEKSALSVQTPKSLRKRFNLDVRTKHEVISIDRDHQKVVIKDLLQGITYEESYDKLILSPGAEPIRPPFEGSRLPGVFTLRSIPDTYQIDEFITVQQPKSVVIVGGGFIGVEMAENLVARGLKVSIVEMANQVIAPLDYDMAALVHNHMREKGVQLLLGMGLEKITQVDHQLNVHLKEKVVTTDFVILAIGVRAESGLAKQANLALNERGGIKVNPYLQTSDPLIYAVGDAIEVVDFNTDQPAMIPLAGPANKQGRIAADNVAGLNSIYKGTQGSSILQVFDLTVAATGMNEKTAQRLKYNYEKSFTHSASHATYYPGAEYMTIKTIYDKNSGRILGAQIVGESGVDKRADVMAVAIRAKMTAKDLTELELCYAPPYSSAKDPVNMAGYTIENILERRTKVFHWHEIPALAQRSDVILLDTRTKKEFEDGHIAGFINLPVDELRQSYSQLDKSKKIYVTCQIGLRGYIACRILSQKGYDCYNLSGGYELYSSIIPQ